MLLEDYRKSRRIYLSKERGLNMSVWIGEDISED